MTAAMTAGRRGDMTEDYVNANRANWDERVLIHLRDTTGMYDADKLRSGRDMLGPIEAAEIGDVTGRRLLHLQCHFGMDTLSLARRGAVVTGLDFSPNAIAAARALASDLEIDARFVEAQVYDAPTQAGRDYDIVFTTWGTIGWLPDVGRWARTVAACLAPGGRLYMADGHPVLFMVEEVDDTPTFRFDWRTPKADPIIEVDDQSYAGDGTPIQNSRTLEWNHPLSDIVTALMEAGLTLEFLREHDRIPWQAFPSMVQADDGTFSQRAGQVKLPLAFSLAAIKRQ